MKNSEEIPQKNKVYLVWQEPDIEGENGYWNQYDSISDAVRENGDGSEVYVSTPKRLGKYRMRSGAERIKTRKRKK